MAFTENIYDGDTLSPQLKQVERLTDKMPRYGIVDRGYRGRKTIEGVKILSPGKLFTSASRYLIQKTRKQFRARAGIEPVIGHLKRDHSMWRNFLLDEEGDKFNTILAATGFNLRKMLQRLEAPWIFLSLFLSASVSLKKDGILLVEKTGVFHVRLGNKQIKSSYQKTFKFCNLKVFYSLHENRCYDVYIFHLKHKFKKHPFTNV